MRDLTWVMNHIASNNGGFAIGLNMHADMTWRMAWCWLQRNFGVYLMLLRYDHRLAGIEYRAAQNHQSPAHILGSLAANAATLLRQIDIAPVERLAAKCRLSNEYSSPHDRHAYAYIEPYQPAR
jgi:hypothetical protein